MEVFGLTGVIPRLRVDGFGNEVDQFVEHDFMLLGLGQQGTEFVFVQRQADAGCLESRSIGENPRQLPMRDEAAAPVAADSELPPQRAVLAVFFNDKRPKPPAEKQSDEK